MTLDHSLDHPLDHFEQALLTDLREHVAARTPARTRSRRWRWAALPAAGAAAVAVAISLGQSTAAYAVDEAGNGDVVVTIHRLDDAAGLEDALQAHGVTADVRYDPSAAPKSDPLEDAGSPASKADDPGPSTADDGTAEHTACSIHLQKSDAGLTFTLGAAQVASDAELEIVTSGSSAADVGSPVAVYWSGGAC